MRVHLIRCLLLVLVPSLILSLGLEVWRLRLLLLQVRSRTSTEGLQVQRLSSSRSNPQTLGESFRLSRLFGDTLEWRGLTIECVSVQGIKQII